MASDTDHESARDLAERLADALVFVVNVDLVNLARAYLEHDALVVKLAAELDDARAQVVALVRIMRGVQ